MIAAGLAVWYLGVLPSLYGLWSPSLPTCIAPWGPCAGPRPPYAAALIVGALAPLAILLATAIASRREAILALGIGALAAACFVGASWFEGRMCPNVFANDCHGRGLVALVWWAAYLGPPLLGGSALGPPSDSPWSSRVALSLAVLIALGVAAAPGSVARAQADEDALFVYLLGLPFVLVPILVAVVLGGAIRAIFRARGNLDASRAPGPGATETT
ncbi:MAG: hypothetical protein KatS3mg014_0666 [Actinomycetota bacterium]|nr:MAG: hypothetical protein KatS3mg014_0666 [Actinomycetota bacterium]